MTSTLKIAVADDEADFRQYFRRLLPRLGYEVVGEAENGRELVDLCRSEEPDLVITDIMMPEMNGIEAATEISKTQTIPIIVLSSLDQLSSDDRPYIVDYLVKPVTIPKLKAAITKACPSA
jgi:CheY-like chemotaxis protein